MAQPETLEEWADYVSSLSDDTLQQGARAANTLEFVKLLQSEGKTSKDIENILYLFAKSLELRDLIVPERGEGSYLSYRGLLMGIQPSEDFT